MAKNSEAERIFKPSLSSAELRASNTTQAAHAIIDEETAKRERKTARLRAARLAKGTEEQVAATEQGKTDKSHKRRQSSPGANGSCGMKMDRLSLEPVETQRPSAEQASA